MDIENIANRICLNLIDNKFFDEMGVKFENIKCQRDLLVKRLNWWMNNMEKDIVSEAPMTCLQISKSVMDKFDKASIGIENYNN